MNPGVIAGSQADWSGQGIYPVRARLAVQCMIMSYKKDETTHGC